tara:strand:+ start:44 stop:301 length:258 start_codon:yes stop_codon:yes gene_type:complete
MRYKVEICVKLKNDVLDPQGKAIQSAAINMGIPNILEVNQGKYFEVIIKNTSSISNAKEIGSKLAEQLLTNQIIENYTILKVQKV